MTAMGAGGDSGQARISNVNVVLVQVAAWSMELERWAGREFSEVDIEGLKNAPAAEWTVAVVDGMAHQDFSAGLAQAQVPTREKQHRLALVLADNTLLPLLLLLQQLPWVLPSYRPLIEPLSAPGSSRSGRPDFLLFCL